MLRPWFGELISVSRRTECVTGRTTVVEMVHCHPSASPPSILAASLPCCLALHPDLALVCSVCWNMMSLLIAQGSSAVQVGLYSAPLPISCPPLLTSSLFSLVIYFPSLPP